MSYSTITINTQRTLPNGGLMILTLRCLFSAHVLGTDFNYDQPRPIDTRAVHNGTWLNGRFREVGFGDLSGRDCAKLFLRLDAGELFLALHESGIALNSHFRHSAGEPPEKIEGLSILDFVIKHLAVIVGGLDDLYVVTHGVNVDDVRVQSYDGFAFHIIDENEARRLILDHQAQLEA